MNRLRALLAKPHVRRTVQHALAAFLTGFTSTLTTAVLGLSGSADAKLLVSLVVGAAAAGGVAAFRAVFPPDIAEALESRVVNNHVTVHVDGKVAREAIAAHVVKALEQVDKSKKRTSSNTTAKGRGTPSTS